MANLEALQQAGKLAMTAKKELEQRIAENKTNWTAASNTVKDIWSSLELGPHTFKIQQAVFTCSADGISNDATTEAARDPKTLNELQGAIVEFLDRTRTNYDERMQS